MAIHNSKPVIKFGNCYICGNCGFELSMTEKLEMEVPVETTPIAGELNTVVSPKSQSFVKCPNCGNDLGHVKIR